MKDIKKPVDLAKTDPRVETVKQILDLPEQKGIWLVERLIPVGCTFLAAVPKSYKTYLALHIAKSIATKKPVFGKFEVTKKLNVLILDKENSPYLIKTRLEQLEIKPKAPIVWSFNPVSSGYELYREELISILREQDIGLLIIDSFRRFHSGDENSSESVAKTFEFLSKIKAMEISIFVLHHLRKSPMIGKSPPEEMLRGSSDLVAYPDNILTVKQIVEDGEIVLKMEQVAVRASEPLSPFTLTIDHPDKDKLDFVYRAKLASEIEKPSAAKTAILELVEEGKVSRTTIQDKLNKEYGIKFIDKQLRRMDEDGLIVKDKGQHNKSIYRKPTKEEQIMFNAAKLG